MSSARTPHRSRTPLGPRSRGEARVGQELTASEGTWTGNPTSFSFQWQRCNIDAITCLDVTGATGRTYGVRIADLGFRLRVQVDGSQGRTARALRPRTRRRSFNRRLRSRTRGRRFASSRSRSWEHGSTCASGSATTSPVISGSWSARRAPACVRHSGALPLASRRVRAVRTREAGFRRSASAVRVGTRSRCGRKTPRAGRACQQCARSAGSSSTHVAGTARRSGASHFHLYFPTRKFLSLRASTGQGEGESSGIERRCGLAAEPPLYRALRRSALETR